MGSLNRSTRSLRTELFSKHWPLDGEIRQIAATDPSHYFLANPSGLYPYVYLTQFVRAFSENHFGAPFGTMRVLDWGCGKGHVSKLIRDLGPERIESCDLLAGGGDSTFGQEVPIIRRYGIQVKPLQHEWVLPYESGSFDVLLSFGVLEHVSDERGSLLEIARVLKPNGLFFCFFLPARFSWTQQFSRWRGEAYHDRLYTEARIHQMLTTSGLQLLDLWYRQLLPKHSLRYPKFRFFEKIDLLMTEKTSLRYLATNIEFVSLKV
jgi:SAM-dependent methyltransferase